MGARREVDDGGDDGDDDSMGDAGTDRDGDSVNDLSGIGRRGFFSKNGFIDESHLMN